MTVRPQDFPRGTSETTGTFPRLRVELRDGQILDVGMEHYGEFIVNLDTAWELLHGGMTSLDGRPGKPTVVIRYENAVQLKWRPE